MRDHVSVCTIRRGWTREESAERLTMKNEGVHLGSAGGGASAVQPRILSCEIRGNWKKATEETQCLLVGVELQKGGGERHGAGMQRIPQNLWRELV